MTDKCCICGAIRSILEIGAWCVPKVKPDDPGIRWACQGACSAELYRKVRAHLRAA